MIALVPSLAERNCYHYKLLYGLFVVAIVTGFFSVLGMWAGGQLHLSCILRHALVLLTTTNGNARILNIDL